MSDPRGFFAVLLSGVLTVGALFAGGQFTLAAPPHPGVSALGAATGNSPVYLGPTNPEQSLDLLLVLTPRHAGSLDADIQAMYTPGSPTYHHFMMPQQFADHYGVSPASFDAVTRFIHAHGLQVTDALPNRLYLAVHGTVTQVERAFNTRIANYRLGDQVVHANVTAPILPAGLPIGQVIGLSTPGQRHSLHIFEPQGSATSAPYSPEQLRAAYGASRLPKLGDGQSISIMIEGDFVGGGAVNDLHTFEAYYRLPPVNVVVGWGQSKDRSGLDEPDLDAQWSTSMAPNVTQLRVYEATTNSDKDFMQMEEHWVNDPAAGPTASESYGECEKRIGTGDEMIWQQAALEGRTAIISSGDSGADECNGKGGAGGANSDPYVMNANGTTIVTDLDGHYLAETVWNGACGVRSGSPSYCGTGGSPSVVFKEPWYQQGISIVDATKMRGVADLSADADPYSGVNYTYKGQTSCCIGGTSLSAPLLNGLLADVDANLAPGKNVGFFNPTLYTLGKANQWSAFHDVTIGNNGTVESGSTYGYIAGLGWDFPTGWGSPNAAGLVDVINRM